MERYNNSFPVVFEYKGTELRGYASPFKHETSFGLPYLFRVVVGDKYFGDVRWDKGEWVCDRMERELVERIGDYIEMWYE